MSKKKKVWLEFEIDEDTNHDDLTELSEMLFKTKYENMKAVKIIYFENYFTNNFINETVAFLESKRKN